MGYAISVEAGTLVVRHQGELTIEAIEASRRAVVDLAAETNLGRILLDLSGIGTSALTVVDIFDLCVTQGSVLPRGATVAVVYRPDQIPTENAFFAETVSLNHGVTLRAFTEFGAAQEWLSETGPPGL